MEQSQSLGQRPRLLLQGGGRAFRPSPFERVVLLAVLLAAAFGGFSVYARATDLNAVPEAAPTYLPAFRTTLSSTVSATGTVQSSQQVTLTFGSTGKIQSFLAKLGDQVTSGQELAKIEDTELRQALKSAESALSSAQARYAAAVEGASASERASAEQAVLSAQGQIASAEQALADLRAKPTATDMATAQQGLLNAQNALQSANDALAKAQDDVLTTQTDLDLARVALDDGYRALGLSHPALVKAYEACKGGGKPLLPTLPGKGATAAAAPSLSASMCPGEGTSANYNSAASAYNSARGTYQAAITGLSSIETSLDTLRKTLSSGNLQRSIQNAQLGVTTAQQKLAETRAGAKASEIEAARRNVDSASASLTAAQARYDDLYKPPTPDVALPLQNAIDQAQADVETAKKNLAAATIIAPFDGQISQVTGEVGSQVSATTAVFILLNPNLIRIDANVDQADVSNIKAGQTANVTFDALPGRSYQAQVAALGLTPTITQGVVTYVVTLSVDTNRLPQGTPVPAPGMTGSIQVTTTRTENALVVPSRAVRRSGRTSIVTVRTSGGATEQRQVTTGVTNGTLVQIVTGLQEGDEVLVSAPSTSTSTTPSQGGPQFFGPGGGGIQIR